MSEIEIAPLQASDLAEAQRIFRVAFGTFLGLPDPAAAFGDRDLFASRWRAGATVLTARSGGRLIGSNVVTRWGSFGFFGPLTVLPELWDQGVAKRLLAATMDEFERWGVRHTGLFTFPHSVKHVGLYQKFGYWPQYLTALMKKTPAASGSRPAVFSELNETSRRQALGEAREITDSLSPGLDLSAEIKSVLEQGLGDTVLVPGDDSLDAFSICHTGPQSEGGSELCYVKFGAARSGPGAGDRFERLLDAVEAFAAQRGVAVEAGVNLAREDAYQRMRARGFRGLAQGVAMQKPHDRGFNRGDVYAIDDWR